MKKILFAVMGSLLLQLGFAQSQDDRKDRIMASYLVAFGILPETGEINYWMGDPLSNKTVNDLVNEHKKNIANQQSLQDRAIRNSYQDVLGRAPRADEYKTWRPLKLTYTDLVSRHLQFLKDYPSAFEDVIRQTYKSEFGRYPSAQELANWKSWGVRSYVSIVREHQKNKKSGMFASNQPSTRVVSSKKSGVQVLLSNRISEEMNRIPNAGVIATGGGNVIATGGGNVISTGGGN